jgi:hypothetical protein
MVIKYFFFKPLTGLNVTNNKVNNLLVEIEKINKKNRVAPKGNPVLQVQT